MREKDGAEVTIRTSLASGAARKDAGSLLLMSHAAGVTRVAACSGRVFPAEAESSGI